MTKTANWFEVDRKGLRKLMEGRPKAFILHELLSNAWDQRVTEVRVSLEYCNRAAFITVEDDDPDGFADLAHAYTLFAESAKKANPEQRGRFNLGEKLVLALAREATISSTKGTIRFDTDGRRNVTGTKRPAGSSIVVEIPMSKADFDEISAASSRVIAPLKAQTYINGGLLPSRGYWSSFEITLPTIVSDDEGVMRRSMRKTWVEVHQVYSGEVASIYEMGIPVVETGDKYHVNVGQKVPLNADRDNVTPAYLRDLRVAVLNHTFNDLNDVEATQTWVKEACSDENVAPEAVKAVIHTRFGENAVIFDPSDPEANKISVSEGRQVVHGGSLSAGEWANVRANNVLMPAGKVTPSPKPFSPDGKPLKLLEENDLTSGMKRIRRFAWETGDEIIGRRPTVLFASDATWPFSATYSKGINELILNVGRLGHAWFNGGIMDEVIDLIIHEYGHSVSGDHLSREYNDALTLIGAKMTRLALTNPEIFK